MTMGVWKPKNGVHPRLRRFLSKPRSWASVCLSRVSVVGTVLRNPHIVPK